MRGQALISELNHFDIFLTGGTILTGIPGQPEIRDGSIGVRDGKITWLGHGTPQSGHTTKRVLKLAGCVVTPGFVNTHTHSILTMVRGVAVDAGFAPSYTPGIPKGPNSIRIRRERLPCAALCNPRYSVPPFLATISLPPMSPRRPWRSWECGSARAGASTMSILQRSRMDVGPTAPPSAQRCLEPRWTLTLPG